MISIKMMEVVMVVIRSCACSWIMLANTHNVTNLQQHFNIRYFHLFLPTQASHEVDVRNLLVLRDTPVPSESIAAHLLPPGTLPIVTLLLNCEYTAGTLL
jgi:hypothetical protein